MTIWLNGRLGPIMHQHATIDPTDRGFTLGDGLFETMRAFAGAAAHLDRHLKRLREGAAILDIPVPATDAAIGDAISQVLRANGLADAAIRLTLTRGPALRGVLPPATPTPTLLITAGPLPPPTATPATAIIATVTRRNERSPLSRIKSLNYLDNILARSEAARRGADEALLLNTQGRIAEGSATNLFLLLDGDLVTPPLADGALPGIARALLIERAGAVERPITPEDLARATAAILSNSLTLRALARIDGHTLAEDGHALAALVSARANSR